MSKGRHFALTKREKILLGVIAFYCVWRFLLSDSVINAFVALIFGGLVPGTSIVLSPVTLLTGVAITIGLIILVFSWKTLAKRRGLAMLSPAGEPTQEVIAPMDTMSEHGQILTPQPVRVNRFKTRQSYHLKHSIRLSKPQVTQVSVPRIGVPSVRLPHLRIQPPLNVVSVIIKHIAQSMSWLTLAVASAIRAIISTTLRLVKVAFLSILHLLRLLAAIVTAVCKTLATAAVRAYQASCLGAIRAWAWAAPYIWRYDKWADDAMRRFGKWLAKKTADIIRRHDNVRFVITTTKEVLKLIPIARLKTSWAAAKDRMARSKIQP
jgi:hypothetical protein